MGKLWGAYCMNISETIDGIMTASHCIPACQHIYMSRVLYGNSSILSVPAITYLCVSF